MPLSTAQLQLGFSLELSHKNADFRHCSTHPIRGHRGPHSPPKMDPQIWCNICLLIVTLWTVGHHSLPLQSPSGELDADLGEYDANLSEKTIRQIRKCDTDLDAMELCMRCAKITKSTIVYPLCCGNEDNVKGWCRDYIYFGLPEAAATQ